MPSGPLSDAELIALQNDLNKFAPGDVREAIEQQPCSRPGAGASGPLTFGSVEPGVLIYRLDPDVVRLRVTATDMTGGLYEEFEFSDDGLRAFVRGVVEQLGAGRKP
ncbi:MAG: hypothetical protein JOZ69_25190 [Myxococcales bacterium]|nr:hypothetical protein [Myxococcales bacterium]